MKKYMVTLLFICGCIPQVFAAFQLQNTIHKQNISFYFPQTDLKSVNRIVATQLDKAIRPQLWPDRIPFGMCIGNNHQNVYYIYYQSILNMDILKLSNPSFLKLEDLCISKSGNVYLVDSQSHALYVYSFKTLTQPILVDKVKTKEPFRCGVSQNRVYVISKTGKWSIYTHHRNTLLFQEKISNIFNSNIPLKTIRDITTTSSGKIWVINDTHVLKISSTGKVILKKALKKPYTAISSTTQNYPVLLDAESQKIDIYNQEMSLLDTHFIGDDIDMIPHDIAVYKPYGLVGISSKSTGVTYALGVTLSSLDVKKFNQVTGDLHYQIQFHLSFPSDVVIKVLSKNGSMVKEFKKTLSAGHHAIHWDGYNLRGEKVKGESLVNISAKATYSLSNVDVKTFRILESKQHI
ncbi:MAG: hypothetical protein HRT90_00040 [Candidatus Margulisbacteria bacterium]|nr:hypothetical protein [Candidatus Margulisiibacteriota bacterium]